MRTMTLTSGFVGSVSALATGYAASPKFVAEMPFESCKGLICVKAQMDDEAPVTLLLDTGGAHNLISVERAKSGTARCHRVYGRERRHTSCSKPRQIRRRSPHAARHVIPSVPTR